MKKKLAYLGLGSLLLAFTACHNSDVEFPDPVTGVSVYFANQYPVRTLVLGNPDNNGVSEIPNVLDNQHKCEIYATMGGSYTGKQIVL
ncbi:MAG: adhesin, partial [Bacteroidaceae bacterium]|nr:adhesin [Bacteroidaceae bacterium]